MLEGRTVAYAQSLTENGRKAEDHCGVRYITEGNTMQHLCKIVCFALVHEG
jgi:hypothetical protein